MRAAMPVPYLADRASVTDAAELIRRHGAGAASEAGRRAGESRTVGNHIHFCRWRQIARWIEFLGDEGARGRVH